MSRHRGSKQQNDQLQLFLFIYVDISTLKRLLNARISSGDQNSQISKRQTVFLWQRVWGVKGILLRYSLVCRDWRGWALINICSIHVFVCAFFNVNNMLLEHFSMSITKVHTRLFVSSWKSLCKNKGLKRFYKPQLNLFNFHWVQREGLNCDLTRRLKIAISFVGVQKSDNKAFNFIEKVLNCDFWIFLKV
jgi:hypothetical protein